MSVKDCRFVGCVSGPFPVLLLGSLPLVFRAFSHLKPHSLEAGGFSHNNLKKTEYVHAHVYVDVCAWACACVHIYVYLYLCLPAYICACICLWAVCSQSICSASSACE